MNKTFIASAVALALPMSTPAWSQPAAPAAKSSQARPAAPSVAEFDKQLAQVQEQMKLMQVQMEKIQATQDPQERQRLLQDHWTSMQTAMAAMHGMMGWGQMRGYYSHLTPEQLKQRQYMMDQYLPMQQLMMNHMMWHQRWMYSTPTPAK